MPAACFKHCVSLNGIINSIIIFPKICMEIIFLKHVDKRKKANTANALLIFYFHIHLLIGFIFMDSISCFKGILISRGFSFFLFFFFPFYFLFFGHDSRTYYAALLSNLTFHRCLFFIPISFHYGLKPPMLNT